MEFLVSGFLRDLRPERPERMNLDVKPRRLLNSQLFWMQWWTF